MKKKKIKKGEKNSKSRGITPSLRRSPNTSPRGFIRRRTGSNKIQNSKYNVHIVFPWPSIMSLRGDNGGLQRNRRRDRAPASSQHLWFATKQLALFARQCAPTTRSRIQAMHTWIQGGLKNFENLKKKKIIIPSRKKLRSL